MNTNKGTQSDCRRIRAITDLPSGARYRKALATLTSTEDNTVSDVFYAARKYHVNPAKLLRHALDTLPATA